MKMRNIYTNLLVLLFIFMASCTERIDLDLDSADPVIVIYGTVTDTLAYQSVAISSTVPYFEMEHNPTVSGAHVTITTSENEIWTLLENDNQKGTYQTETLRAGKPGETYHLKVEYDFNQDGTTELYEASSTMLSPIQLDSVQIGRMDHMGKNSFTVNLFAQEPVGEDFYFSKYYVNDTLATKLSKYGMMNDLFMDGEYLNGYLVYFFADMAEIDDYSDNSKKNRTFLSSGDELIVEFNRIEKSYYKFVKQAQDVKDGENPMFGGPPSNIQGNISNGAVGFFSTYSPARLTVVVP